MVKQVKCADCGKDFDRDYVHIHGYYTLKTGERVYRYMCRPCKRARAHRYRAIRIVVQQ